MLPYTACFIVFVYLETPSQPELKMENNGISVQVNVKENDDSALCLSVKL